MDTLLDRYPYAVHNRLKLGLGHVPGLRLCEHLSRDRSYALGGLKDRVVDLEVLLLLARLLVAPALELARDLIGPSFQSRIDGFEVDTRVAPDPPAPVPARRSPRMGG